MLTTLLDSNSRVDFCNSQTWKHADRIAPDKVQTGFDRIVEVKKTTENHRILAEPRLFGPNQSHDLIKHISRSLLSFVISSLFPPLSLAAAFSLFAGKKKERRKKEGYKQSAVEATKSPRGL